MTLDAVRTVCRALPGVTEDIKRGTELVFSIGSKVLCVVNTVRLVWIVLAVIPGAIVFGVFADLVAWFIIPTRDLPAAVVASPA